MKKITIVTTFNLSEIVGPLVQKAKKQEYLIDVRVENYDDFLRRTDNLESDAYILALDLRDCFPEFFSKLYPMHCSEIEYRCNALVERISTFAKNVSESGGKSLIHNFNYPQKLASGIYDFQNAFGQLSWIDYLNNKLSNLPETISNAFIINMQFYIYNYGADKAVDLARYYTSKKLYTEEFHEYLADKYVEFIKAMFGVRKKCLVVDLDNTLWGGVIGEDGLNEIHLGEKYPGNVYREIQHAMDQYADQGIILAICSKNNEEDVVDVFNNHRGMVLKYEDFAAKRINWEAKAVNLQSIADELNIGLDSMIFVDDDPFEIEMVRQKLPEVEVVQLTADVLLNLRIVQNIESLNYLTYVEEDMQRRAQYRQKNQIDHHREGFSSLEDFYRSLKIRVEISLSEQKSTNRIAQLTKKTNQFNLTARRYSESDIVKIMTKKEYKVYSMRVVDRFGDNGITGVAIVKADDCSWKIDTFLLSCRVIGRTVEQALLSRIQDDAEREGAIELVGYYVPTSRNALARDFYEINGFQKSGDKWVLNNNACRVRVPEWISMG